jgi:hypothetical protein
MSKEDRDVYFRGVLLVLLFVTAFLEQPYFLAVVITLMVIRQLGYINSTLRNNGDI